MEPVYRQPGAATCIRCGKRVPDDAFETLCLTCQVVTNSQPPQEDPRRGQMKIVIVAGLLVVVGIGAGAIIWKKRAADREAFRDQYPVGLTSVERERGERDARAWKQVRDKLVATAQSFDTTKIPIPERGAPCPLAQRALSATDVTSRNLDSSLLDESFSAMHDGERYVDRRFVAGENLVAQITDSLDVSIAAMERGRFASERARDGVLDFVARDSLVIVALTVDQPPMIAKERDSFMRGHRAGTAYVFDRATGDLACAGAFEASSSDEVQGLENLYGGNMHVALDRDFEANTDRAIAAAVRSVR